MKNPDVQHNELFFGDAGGRRLVRHESWFVLVVYIHFNEFLLLVNISRQDMLERNFLPHE
jgi:hypothetical protein